MYTPAELFGEPWRVYAKRHGRWYLVHTSGSRAYCLGLAARYIRTYDEPAIVTDKPLE